MLKSLRIIAAATIAMASIAHAQENLVGDWSGSYLFRASNRDVPIGVELKITAVEGNAVTGSAKTYGGNCAGEYQLRGKLDGDNLGMISTNSAGQAGDCKFGFRATIEGNTIKGTVGPSALNLNRK